MALAQGDWVSVKHQDLIEFVLKWVMWGTLLIQSWRPIRLGGLAFPTTCCMLISLCASWVLKDQTASKCDTICQLAFRHAQGHIYICPHHVYKTQSCISHYQAKCYMMAVLIQHYLQQRLPCIFMRIQCHLIFLCCWSLINNLILQASWMWQHFCHIVMYFLCHPPWDSSTWMRLWWHTIIFPVKGIRMADLLESQWALSPWNRNNNWNGTLALWSRMQCWCVRACVCSRVRMVLWLCIKPVAHECLHMCLYGCVGEHLSGATVHLHWLNQIKPSKTNIFAYYLVLDIYHLPSISSSHGWNLSNVMGAIGQVV